MVDRQLLAAWLRTTVLTHELVPLEDIPPAERHRVRRQAVVLRQRDDFRNTQLKSASLYKQTTFVRSQLRPVFPRVLLVVSRINDPSLLVPDLRQRLRNGGDADRLPVAIQHQRWSIKYSSNHRTCPFSFTVQAAESVAFRTHTPRPSDPNVWFGGRSELNRRRTDSQSVSGNQHRTRPQRKERESNPQGTFVLDRLPTGSRLPSGGPSVCPPMAACHSQ